VYRYNTNDKQLLAERANQFKNQTLRYLAGELEEEEFRPLRLQNGLYIQRQAPMLRIAVPTDWSAVTSLEPSLASLDVTIAATSM